MLFPLGIYKEKVDDVAYSLVVGNSKAKEDNSWVVGCQCVLMLYLMVELALLSLHSH